MSDKITLQEYEEIEKVREKEIKGILKLACKLLEDADTLNHIKDKFIYLKYESCVSDLKSIFNIIMELKRLREKIKEDVTNG